MSGFPMPGHRIGPFLVVREIGRGPTGVVLECLDTTAAAGPARVAMKVRTPSTTLPEGLHSRYRADLDRLAAVGSPRLLPVLRVGIHEGRLLTVTPYVAGGDAAARLAAGPLPAATALAWATALAEGLAAVHAAGLVHGGVRASNLLVRPEGDPVLTDVGGSLLTQAWVRPPGPAAPPDEAGADAVARTAADDVRAAGVLIAALAGDAAGAALDEVIRRATAADPAQRYPDGDALARALRVVPPGELPRSGEERSLRRRRTTRLAVGGLVAAAAAAAVVAALAHDRTPPPAAEAATGSATTVGATRPPAPRVSHAPSYRSVVFTLTPVDGATVQVDRGDGWRTVATRTVTLPTRVGGDRACLRVRSLLHGRAGAPRGDCGRSQPPELTVERHPDCLVDGAFRQVCYTLIARGLTPGEDDRLTFSVDGRSMGTAVVHIGRDGTGTLPDGQHFHFADADAGATARITMAGLSHSWRVDRRG